jgi:steroid delta-isomerase-like uncharacterized protein
VKRIVFLLFVLLAAEVCIPTDGDAKATDQAVVQQAFAAWNTHDVNQVMANYSEDAVYEDVPFRVSNHGQAEMRKYFTDTFAMVPDLKVDVVSTIVVDGHCAVEWNWSGTDKGLFKTGLWFSIRGTSLCDVRGGKLVREQDFYDVATLMRQLQLLPAHGPRVAAPGN